MILITGSSGFVGRNLIKKLIKKNYKICCLVRKETNKEFVNFLKNNNIKVIEASVNDLSQMKKILERIKISYVIHLAALLKTDKVNDYYNTNVEGIRNLIDICKKKKIKKFIFLSSYVVNWKKYSDYGKSKYEAELILKNSKLPYIILRSSPIYGKDDKINIMPLVKLIKKYPFIPIIGDGNYELQPIFINDVIKIIIKCLKLKNNRTYYICSDRPLKFNNIVDIIAKALNKKIYKMHIPLLLVRPIIKIYEILFKNPFVTLNQINYIMQTKKLDNTPIKKEFNFRFTDFKEGISKSIN